MKTIILLTILILTSIGKVVAQSDHLEPIDGILYATDYRYEYHSNIRKTLLKDFHKYSKVRYIVTPSFEREFAFEIAEDSISNYISYCVTNKKIWNIKDVNTIQITKIRKNLPLESVVLIEELFSKVLAQTQYIRKDWVGGDGTSYYFYKDFEAGTTWSPKQATRMEQLVNICNDLIKFAQNTETDLSENLKKKIKRLTRKI